MTSGRQGPAKVASKGIGLTAACDDMPWVRKLGNKFFVSMVNLIWGTHYTDLCYGYRSFKKKMFEKLKLKSKGFSIETEMAIKVAKKGFNVLEVPSFEKAREAGEGKLRTFRDGWFILKKIIEELLGD